MYENDANFYRKLKKDYCSGTDYDGKLYALIIRMITASLLRYYIFLPSNPKNLSDENDM